MKSILWNTFKYLLALGLLGHVIAANWNPPSGRGLKDVWMRQVLEEQSIHGVFLGLGFSIMLVSLTVTLARWHVLVRAQSLPFPMSEAMRLGFMGFFFNTFLPGSVGGDILKAAALTHGQSRRTVAVATVIMDRVIGLWSLVWFVSLVGGGCWVFGLLDGPSAGPAKKIVLSAQGILAVSVVIWLILGRLTQTRARSMADQLSRIPKVGHSAAEFWRAVWLYRCRQSSVALAMGMSWISHVGLVLAFYCCARALWDELPTNPLPTLTEHFLIVPIGLVIAAIPLFPGGAGISEAGYGGLYTLFHSAQANGIIAALVYRVVNWIVSVIGCLMSFVIRPRIPEESAPSVPAMIHPASSHATASPAEPEMASCATQPQEAEQSACWHARPVRN